MFPRETLATRAYLWADFGVPSVHWFVGTQEQDRGRNQIYRIRERFGKRHRAIRQRYTQSWVSETVSGKPKRLRHWESRKLESEAGKWATRDETQSKWGNLRLNVAVVPLGQLLPRKSLRGSRAHFLCSLGNPAASTQELMIAAKAWCQSLQTQGLSQSGGKEANFCPIQPVRFHREMSSVGLSCNVSSAGEKRESSLCKGLERGDHLRTWLQGGVFESGVCRPMSGTPQFPVWFCGSHISFWTSVSPLCKSEDINSDLSEWLWWWWESKESKDVEALSPRYKDVLTRGLASVVDTSWTAGRCASYSLLCCQLGHWAPTTEAKVVLGLGSCEGLRAFLPSQDHGRD